MARKKKWIQEAIKRPGRLRTYVKRRYGSRGFTEKGTIRVEVLREIAEHPENRSLAAAARLALRLRKMGR